MNKVTSDRVGVVYKRLPAVIGDASVTQASRPQVFQRSKVKGEKVKITEKLDRLCHFPPKIRPLENANHGAMMVNIFHDFVVGRDSVTTRV